MTSRMSMWCNFVIFINSFSELLKLREYLINEYVASNQFWKYEEMFQYNSIFVHLKEVSVSVSVSVWWLKEPTRIIFFYLANYEISRGFGLVSDPIVYLIRISCSLMIQLYAVNRSKVCPVLKNGFIWITNYFFSQKLHNIPFVLQFILSSCNIILP